jgi:DNA invertase Pin-like site-specific DNA recombinase
MKIGYARVSTKEQNLDMQIDALKEWGVDRIYQEKVTGTKADREQLNEALKVLREGDTLVVWKLDRLGRTTKQLMELIEQFKKEKITFVSLSENIDTSSHTGAFVLTVFCALAQMERDILVERTRSGLASARARGRVGGRPPIKGDKVKTALALYDAKSHTINEIVKATGVSRATLYNYVNQRKNENPFTFGPECF